jgi:hypothetical protein
MSVAISGTLIFAPISTAVLLTVAHACTRTLHQPPPFTKKKKRLLFDTHEHAMRDPHCGGQCVCVYATN